MLWKAKMHPLRPIPTLSQVEIVALWQALPGQRYNERLRRALPWLAGTTLGNVLCQLVATA